MDEDVNVFESCDDRVMLISAISFLSWFARAPRIGGNANM